MQESGACAARGDASVTARPGTMAADESRVPATPSRVVPLAKRRVLNAFDFELGRQVGAGAFASVYIGTFVPTGELVAVKRLHKPTNQMDEAEAVEVRNETALLTQLQHPNVVRFYGSYIDEDVMHMAMEYCGGGTLEGMLRTARSKGEQLPVDTVWELFVQIVMSVQFVHERNVLHRDLKTANVLLGGYQGREVKLGDFGISKSLAGSESGMAQSTVGTPYYLSPELCNGKPYDHHADVWAVGVILFELATLARPFEAGSIPAIMMKIAAGERQPAPSDVDPQIRQLIGELLAVDPAERPTADDLLRRPAVSERIRKWEAELPRLRTLYEAEQAALASEVGSGADGGDGSASRSRWGSSAATTGGASLTHFMGRSARVEAFRVLTSSRPYLLGHGTTRPRPFEKLMGKDVVDFSFGAGHRVARTSSGELYVWGRGDSGRLGLGEPAHQQRHPQLLKVLSERRLFVSAISTNQACCAAIANGKLLLWGEVCCARGLGLVPVTTAVPIGGTPADASSTAASASVGAGSAMGASAEASFVAEGVAEDDSKWPTWAKARKAGMDSDGGAGDAGNTFAQVEAAAAATPAGAGDTMWGDDGGGADNTFARIEAEAAVTPAGAGDTMWGEDGVLPSVAGADNTFAMVEAAAAQTPAAAGDTMWGDEPDAAARGGGVHAVRAVRAGSEEHESAAAAITEPVNPFARGGKGIKSASPARAPNPFASGGSGGASGGSGGSGGASGGSAGSGGASGGSSGGSSPALSGGASPNPFARGGAHKNRNPYAAASTSSPGGAARGGAGGTAASSVSPSSAGSGGNPFARGGKHQGKNPYAQVGAAKKPTSADAPVRAAATEEALPEEPTDPSTVATTSTAVEDVGARESDAAVAGGAGASAGGAGETEGDPDADGASGEDDGASEGGDSVDIAPIELYEPHVATLTKLSRIAQVACGEFFILLLTSNGQVFSFGQSDEGQLGLGDDVARDTPCQITKFVKAKKKRPRSAARRPGRRSGPSKKRPGSAKKPPKSPGPGSDAVTKPAPFAPPVTHIVAGREHALCVTKDMVFAWGHSDGGRLGLGGDVDMSGVKRPTEIAELRDQDIVQVSASEAHCGAVSADGRVWMWGSNCDSQLGLGRRRGVDPEDDIVVSPEPLTNLHSKVVQLSCGETHTVARVQDEGEVYWWGRIGTERILEPRPVGGLRDCLHVEACRWGDDDDTYDETGEGDDGERVATAETFAIVKAARSASGAR